MSQDGRTIYQRIGGRAGITRIAKDILCLHHANGILGRRYRHQTRTDTELERLLAELLCSVTCGSETYTGMSVVEMRRGLNIDPNEFSQALDDIVEALEMNGVDHDDRDSILGTSYGHGRKAVGL